MAREVLLWCLTSSGLVGLILLRDLKHLKQDWCCPAWFQLDRALTLQTLLLFPSSCRSREFVGAGLWWVHRGCLCEEAGAHVLHSSSHFPAQF